MRRRSGDRWLCVSPARLTRSARGRRRRSPSAAPWEAMPGHVSAGAILAATESGQPGPIVVTLLRWPVHQATRQGPWRAGQRSTASVRVHPVRAARDSPGRCRPRLPVEPASADYCNTLSNGAWPPPQLLAEEGTGVYSSVSAWQESLTPEKRYRRSPGGSRGQGRAPSRTLTV